MFIFALKIYLFFFFEDDTNILYAVKKFSEIHLDLICKRIRFLLLARNEMPKSQQPITEKA